MEENRKKLYTLLVYSENVAGILNQVTAVFTRRQVNIESLNVSASSIPGVHKYTITAWSDEDQIVKITKQIEKKVDVVNRFQANIIEVNATYVIVQMHGVTEDIISLYRALDTFGCVLQYTRSGRIAVTRGMQEQVSEFLEQRENQL